MPDPNIGTIDNLLRESLETLGRTLDRRAEYQAPSETRPFHQLVVYANPDNVEGVENVIEYIVGLSVARKGNNYEITVSGNMHPRGRVNVTRLEGEIKSDYAQVNPSRRVRKYFEENGVETTGTGNYTLNELLRLGQFRGFVPKKDGAYDRSYVVSQSFTIEPEKMAILLEKEKVFLGLLQHYVLGEFHSFYQGVRKNYDSGPKSQRRVITSQSPSATL